MKRLLFLCALLAVSIVPARAQITRFVENSFTLNTNFCMNLATNSYLSGTDTNLVLSIENQDNVGIAISGTLISSNFCKPRLDFMSCVASGSWCTTNFIQVTCLGGLSSNNLSAGTFSYNTNVDVRGLRALKLFQLANTDYHGIMTNVVITYSIKR